MKVCNNCGVTKPYVEFNKDKSRSDGYEYRCKECNIIYSRRYYNDNSNYYKKRYNSIVLPYWIVYLLPDHNYIGKTNNPYFRMNEHRTQHNRNTSNWVELHRFDTEAEALAKEAEYHAQGYAGKYEKKSRCRNSRTL